MAKENPSKILFSLSEIDKSIEEQRKIKEGIELGRRRLKEDWDSCLQRIQDLELQTKEALQLKSVEESRLREEEQRIVERRRQLTALGGVKSAKLIEREIDIAGRALEALEKNLADASAVADKLNGDLEAVSARAKEIEEELKVDLDSNDKILQDVAKKMAELGKERNVLLGKIDERLRNLYARVNNHYPGQAVALAKKASCRSCYRALPAQLYNQVMAGNRLLQCPGCSRILVYSE